jgi:pyruvate dehydrogenase E2 component (dihydrolipoamide acetyltransferase)
MATQEVLVPDIGDYKDIPVIEVLVKPGDQVEAEAPLVTLESDKATMDVPAPASGVVKQVKVKVGDKVSQGTLVLTLETDASGGKAAPGGRTATPVEGARPEKPFQDAAKAPEHEGPVHEAAPQKPPAPIDEAGFHSAHAGPGVRRLARELGVDLSRVKGQGPKGRILKEDVHAYVKSVLSGGAAGGAGAGVPAGAGLGFSLPGWPKVDFAKFGPVEQKPLTRLQKIAGPALHRNWVSIPHVTSCEDADVTELEAFRVQLNAEAGKQDKSAVKVTMLAFLVKACVAALQKFPNFNSSLDGENLVLKRYYNVAFAADTPQGLVVPVIKDADKKGVLAIAKETSELAGKARDGKLAPSDMQGATFTISSLGGIGGTYFTPIINAPEVAILGVCRAQHRPVWDGEKFAPRLILPLSLSWDHRVLDGAAAARFNVQLATLLADVRRLLL